MNATNHQEYQALSRAVLEIDVNNHAGVMSHVVGLFSRRAYNVDGILCLPLGDSGQPFSARTDHPALRIIGAA